MSLLFAFPAFADPSPGTAKAQVDCGPNFALLLSKVTGGKTQAYYREKIAEVEETLVKDVFPETITRRGNTLVKLTDANKKQFNALFDQYWDSRAYSGGIPTREISEYRAYLRAKNGMAYPPFESSALYKEYIDLDPPKSIGAYFDDIFLDYLLDSKKVTASNVQEYINSIDPSIVRRWAKKATRGLKKVKGHVATAALTATVLQVSTLPGDFVNALFNGLSQAFFGQTLKEWLNTKTKQATTTVGEKVRDWNLFAGGEEKYISTVLELKMASAALENRDFDAMTRPEALQTLENFKNYTSEKLPLFRDMVLSEQKDFESLWDQRLQELKQSTVTVNSTFQQYKIALDGIRANIAARPDQTATPEELELMTEYTQEMTGAEIFLANSLADWMFYTQARGKKNPIDKALDLSFTMVYNSYMRKMSPGLLAKAMNSRVKGHVAQLEQYSKKAAGQKDTSPSSPLAKPEDQIKEGTESILRPDPFPPFGGPR